MTSSMAEVLFTRRAKRDLDRLDPTRRRRVLSKVRDYAEDPLAYREEVVRSEDWDLSMEDR